MADNSQNLQDLSDERKKLLTPDPAPVAEPPAAAKPRAKTEAAPEK
jgi:hypothetical protein